MKGMSVAAPTAQQINDAHEMARSHAQNAVEYAIRCGRLLAEKKASLDRGEFDPWVEKHCDFGRRTAYDYMRCAKPNRAAVLHDSDAGAAAAASFPSIRSLLGYSVSKSEKAPDAPSNTTARSARRAVMNPPESAALGSEARNRTERHGEAKEGVRPPPPAPDEPEAPSAEEEEAIGAVAAAELDDYIQRLLTSDDKLATAHVEIERQCREIATLKSTRNHFQNQAGELARLIKSRDRAISKLEGELQEARAQIRQLRRAITAA